MSDPDRLASSFGTAAAAYAEHRPDYAPDAVRWALEHAPGPRMLDLGAGTGKLTGTLLGLGADVVAVEPDGAMLAELRRSLPGVRAEQGSAEAIPLPDASVDAVVAGNALHWFDPAAAWPEVARVLAPGGVVAGLWNVLDDRVGWVSELARIAGPAAVGPRDTLGAWRAATTDLLAGLGPAEQAEFAHRQRRTAESLAATLGTRAGVLVLPAHERAGLLERVRAFLASRPATATEFDLPLLTGVLRLARASAGTPPTA